MKQIKVFVSSTFRDMQTERDTLMYQVAPRINNILKKHGISVQFVDLRWGVDTNTCSESEQDHHVLNRCIDEIRKSRPFFIGILGDRYGWVPPTEVWQHTIQQLDENEAQHVGTLHQMPTSVTELEIILGAMMDQQLLRRSLFLFRNLTSTNTTSIQNSTDYIENNPVAKEKLQQLKTRIQHMMNNQMLQKHIVEYDAEYADERVKIPNTFVNQIVDFLIREITLHELGNASSIDERNIFDHVLELEAQFEQKRTSYFQGRTETLQTIHNRLDSGIPTVLIGHAGTGRSALMAQYKKLVISQTDYIVLTHYAELCSENFSVNFMWRKWIYQMSELTDTPYIPNEIAQTNKELQIYLQEIIKKSDKKVILIIDGLEQLTDFDSLNTIQECIPNAHFICTLEAQYKMMIARLVQQNKVYPLALNEQINNQEIQNIIQSFGQSYSKEINPIVVLALVNKYEDGHHCAAQPIWLQSMLHQLIYFTAEDYVAIDSMPASTPMQQIIQYQLQLIDNAQGYPESLFAQRFSNIPEHMSDAYFIVYILGMAPRGLYREDLISMLTLAKINATLAISNALSWFGDMITEYTYDGRIKLAHSCLISNVIKQDMHVINNIYQLYLTQIKRNIKEGQAINSLILDAFTDIIVIGQETDFVPALFNLENSDYSRTIDRVYWLIHKNADHVFTWLNKSLNDYPVITTHIICSLSRKIRHIGEHEIANKLLYAASDVMNTPHFATGVPHDLRINLLVDYAYDCIKYLDIAEQENAQMAQSIMQIADEVLSCVMEDEERAITNLHTQHRVLSLAYLAGVHNVDKVNKDILTHFLNKSIEIGETLVHKKDFSIIEQHLANISSIYYLDQSYEDVGTIEEYREYVQYLYSNNPSLQIQYEKLASRYHSTLLYQLIGATTVSDIMQHFILDELKELQQSHKFIKFDELQAEIELEMAWSPQKTMGIMEVDDDDLQHINGFVRRMHALLVSTEDYVGLWRESSWSIEDRIHMGIWAYMHHYSEIGAYIYKELKQIEESTNHKLPPVDWGLLKIIALYKSPNANIAEKVIHLHDTLKQVKAEKKQEAVHHSSTHLLASRFITLFFGLVYPINKETINDIWKFVGIVLNPHIQSIRNILQQAQQQYQQDFLLYEDVSMNIDAQTEDLALYEDIVRIFERMSNAENENNNHEIYTDIIENLSVIMKHFGEHQLLDKYGYYNTHRLAYEILSTCYEKISQPTESMLYLQKNKEILYEVCLLHPNNMTLLRDYAIALDHMANWLVQQHNDKEIAYKYIQQAAPIFEYLYKENPKQQFDNYLVNQYFKFDLEVECAKDKTSLISIIESIYEVIEQIKRDAEYAYAPTNKIAMLLDTISDAYYKIGDESSMIKTLREAQELFKSIYLEHPQDGPALRDYLKSSFRMMHYVKDEATLRNYYPIFLKEYNNIIELPAKNMQLRTLMIWLMIQEKVMGLYIHHQIPFWENATEKVREITEAISTHIFTGNGHILQAWINVLRTIYTPLDKANNKEELSDDAFACYRAVFSMEFNLKKALLDQSIYTWEDLEIETTQARGIKLGMIQQ